MLQQHASKKLMQICSLVSLHQAGGLLQAFVLLFLRADDDKVSVLAKNIIDKVAINQTLTKVRGTAELKKVICAMPSSSFLDFYAMSF